MSFPERPKYWFPAKRYGWGWGAPCCWQGWVVTLVYFALFAGCVVWLQHGDKQEIQNRLPIYLGGVGVLTVVLLGICWAKGEPPSWRWGEKR